jgi:hypothetical protein
MRCAEYGRISIEAARSAIAASTLASANLHAGVGHYWISHTCHLPFGVIQNKPSRKKSDGQDPFTLFGMTLD